MGGGAPLIMLRLTYSNRSELNLARMAEEIRRLQRQSPLTPIQIVVPHRQVELWIRQSLAQSLGVAANLDVVQLKRFVLRLIEARHGAAPIRLIDSETLLDQLLAIFFEPGALDADTALAPLARYLDDASETSAFLRRFQLAAALARLFDEYALSRDFLDRWERGEAVGFAEAAARQVERWQAALWRLLRARFDKLDGRYVSIGELSGMEEIALVKPTFLFGISHMALAYHRLIDRLSKRSPFDLHVYALNPCAELWEHVHSDRERRRAAPADHPAGEDDLFGLSAEQGHPLLQAWGRPGRENIRVLNEVTDCDFEDAFAPPPEEAPTSVLARLQNDIRSNVAISDIAPFAADATDRSIEILSCASVQRECETVAGAVASLFRDDPSLRFGEVAVLVAGAPANEHFAHLSSALAALGVPTCRSEIPLERSSRLAEAARLLIELPLTRFTRSDVLAVLDHPALRGHLKDLDRGELPGLVDRLGIHYGLDREDQGESYLTRQTDEGVVDGAVELDLFNWDQGLKRLALGEVMWTEAEGEARAWEVRSPDEGHPRRYWPETPPMAFEGQTGSWTLLVRSLLEDARFAAQANRQDRPECWRTLFEWARFFDALFATYLFAEDDLQARERDLLCRTARAIGLHRILGHAADGTLDRPLRVPYRIACELLGEALQGLRGRRGSFLIDGVAVGPFQPQRALPFRHVFVLGLTGAFPGQTRRDPLDLRREKLARSERRLTRFDVFERERGQYLFLETLLAARERLVLSFVGHDQVTDNALAPSGVIADLERVLGLYAPGRSFRREIPARRCDLALFPSLAALVQPATAGARSPDFPALPEARREATALALRALLERLNPEATRAFDRRRQPMTRDDFQKIVAPLGDEDRAAAARIAEALGLLPASLDAPVAADDVREVTLSISQLRGFLENPAQASARVTIGLRDDRDEETDDALAALDDERFTFEDQVIDRAMFLRAQIAARIEAASTGDPSPTTADLATALARLSGAGTFPAGIFGEIERAKLLDVLDTWTRAFASLTTDGQRFQRVFFGEASEHEPVREIRPAIDLGELTLAGGARVHVRLRGTTGLIGADARTGTPQRAFFFKPGKTKKSHDCLRGFFDALACLASRASGAGADAPCTFTCCSVTAAPDGKNIDEKVFSGISPRSALDYLRGLAAELLDGAHLYWLPGEAVLDAFSAKNKNTLARKLAGERQGFGVLRQNELDALRLPTAEEIERAFVPSAGTPMPRWRFVIDHCDPEKGFKFREERLNLRDFTREEAGHG